MGEVAAIEVENLVRRFGDVEALSRVSLSVRQGEFFSLLGPSGCGKTTLLRIIGGLDLPDEGVVRIGGIDVREIPAHRRPVNTVFQSYALFPHMTVWDNVAFGLRMKKASQADIAQRVGKALDLVQIAELAARKPAQLSGGQRQRVALARAVVNEPQVLLLDEPLGALDFKLRKQLQVELLALQRRLGITFIYVTHDQEEALVLSSRLAVMRSGRIEQVGEIAAVYERPRTRFVAQFLGACNLLDASVLRRNAGEVVVETLIGTLRVDCAATHAAAAERARFTLAIRPEKIQLAGVADGAGENRVRVTVEEVIYVGSETHYIVRANDQRFAVETMNAAVGPRVFNRGQAAEIFLPPGGLLVLDD